MQATNRNCKHELTTAIDAIDHLIKLPSFSFTLSARVSSNAVIKQIGKWQGK